MRVLILSGNTGEGHNSCAKAIKEYYENLNEECVIEDGLRFISQSVSRFISWGHVWIYRNAPRLFKFGYSYAEKHPSVFKENSPIYGFFAKSAERLYRYINDGGYDAVICTHVFSALMLTAVMKKYELKISGSFVATDYTCSPSVKDSNLDFYFIPDSALMPDFEGANTPRQKIIASGIPVRQMFYMSVPRDMAKKSEGISPEHKHLLMTCGSMGCGPIYKLTKLLSQKLNDNQELTIVCGTNIKLKEKLERRYQNFANIHIKGFVQDMSVLMDSADLYLTKPGGISVSEAAVKGLPMVFIDAVAGCEEYNRSHFIEKGTAETSLTVEQLANICIALLQDNEKLSAMRENLLKGTKYNASEIIYNTVKTGD